MTSSTTGRAEADDDLDVDLCDDTFVDQTGETLTNRIGEMLLYCMRLGVGMFLDGVFLSSDITEETERVWASISIFFKECRRLWTSISPSVL